MRVLGVDPGAAAVFWAVIDSGPTGDAWQLVDFGHGAESRRTMLPWEYIGSGTGRADVVAIEQFIIIPWRPAQQAGADTLRMQGRVEAECRMANAPLLLIPRSSVKAALGITPKTKERFTDEATKAKLKDRGLYVSSMTRDHVAAACVAVTALLNYS